jgi:long-chain acyl-CoA synthetase
MTTGNALAGNITFGLRTKLIAPAYKIISFLPLAHAYGCAFEFLASTCAGCHIYFIGKTPSPKILLQAFAEIRPNVIFCVPLIIEKIYKKQIQPLLAKPSMRWVLSIPFLDQPVLGQIRKKLIDAFGGDFSEIVVGGAPLNAEVEEFFNKIKFPFTVGYGMTECAPLISYSHAIDFKPKSSGKLLDILEAKILSPNQAEEGEICVRGENIMLGYYKNAEATVKILDNDGWLHTGDLGKIDSEGNVFIRGRNKTMILSASGQNIFPEEIEAKLNNMPFVMESLVIESNNKLIALVYPDYDALDVEKIELNQLENLMEENRKLLNSMVASYESVFKIQLYPHEFEKTPKKSIKRYLYST